MLMLNQNFKLIEVLKELLMFILHNMPEDFTNRNILITQ